MAAVEFPEVFVSIVLVQHGGMYLAEYNPKWQTYTLPMSRRKRRQMGAVAVQEPPLDAAVRAAAKAIGRPLAPAALPQAVNLIVPAHQLSISGRDSHMKSYNYHLFTMPIADPEPRHALGWHTLWLTREEFLENRPVSPTAVFVFEHLP